MKIRFGMGGAEAARPDFGMLREGLRVAQGNTPTALANGKARAAHAPHADALVRMFAGPETIDNNPQQGSFYPDLPSVADGSTKL